MLFAYLFNNLNNIFGCFSRHDDPVFFSKFSLRCVSKDLFEKLVLTYSWPVDLKKK